MRLYSFGHDFLTPTPTRPVSTRRWNAALSGARKRWPGGFVEYDLDLDGERVMRYMAPNLRFPDRGPLCGLVLYPFS